MKIILLAMPNASDALETACELPNLALVSLAAAVKHHDVHVLDLVLKKPFIKRTIDTVLTTYNPEVIGLSAMTFQFDTLCRIASYIKEAAPHIKIVVGGYHATLMFREICESGTEQPFDFIVRGEGEATFSELIDQLATGSADFSTIKGLSFKQENCWQHNPERPLLDLANLPLPNRSSRLDNSFTTLGQSMDVIETSRGCPNNCNFCCITHMYGRSFRPFPINRIVQDLKNIKANGTRSVFVIDDNITHSIDHFKQVCTAIIDNGLNDLLYMTQVTAAGIANNPDLVDLMDKANFRIIFVGFESMDPDVLRAMRKPTSPKINRKAAAMLRKHNMAIIAGAIVGFAEDTRDSIRTRLQQIRSLVPDSIYLQYITPYPKTALREEMLAQGLVVNKDDFSEYDGFSCVVRTNHLSREELYRTKKIECLKPYFNLKMIWNNYFLRHYFFVFLVHEIKTIGMIIYNIATFRQRQNKIDI